MNARDHWEEVYRSRAPEAVSWYRPHLEISLDLIRQAAIGPASAILDVGGGEATLVDDLILAGYQRVAVLDISTNALEEAKKRLGAAAERVCWIAGDVTALSFRRHSIDVWHDRAVFHFLVEAEDRAAYICSLLSCVRPGGHAIIATFGPEAPSRCSGLPVVRYNSESLQSELGCSFTLVESREELHLTPRGTPQQFVYCSFQIESASVPQKP
ncbi:MAG: class I SAM-dependent methyltransferase [Silvibacterium sp.]|nr:class I SAM-dependent methyltransferase [Silvibacterium sp.]